MSTITLQLSLSGRPLNGQRVCVEAVDDELTTDERGCVRVELPEGRHRGEVLVDDEPLPFEVASAPGLRRVRVDLRRVEKPIDDPGVLAAMPSSRYVPLKLLGQGGAGRVYKCRDTNLDRLVAVKILNEDFAGAADNQDMFLSEARVLAKVDNPHLLQIYDFGIHRNRAYMAVQYIDGPNLEQLIATEGKLDPGSSAATGVQLAHALLAVHEAGLLHCDVKPGNGLVDRKGVVRLADFGLVKPIVDYTDPRSRVFGTPSYMSPEQIQGQPLGPAADVYSLGATLVHLASGSPPFEGNDLILSHVLDPPPDIRRRAQGVPDALAELLVAMMAKVPANRPDTPTVITTLLPLATEVPHREEALYIPRISTPTLGLPLPGSLISGPAPLMARGPEGPKTTTDVPAAVQLLSTPVTPMPGVPVAPLFPSEEDLPTTTDYPPRPESEPVTIKSGRRVALAAIVGVTLAGASVFLAVGTGGPDNQATEEQAGAADPALGTSDEQPDEVPAGATAAHAPGVAHAAAGTGLGTGDLATVAPMAVTPSARDIDYGEVAGLRGVQAAVAVETLARRTVSDQAEAAERARLADEARRLAEAAERRQAERERRREERAAEREERAADEPPGVVDDVAAVELPEETTETEGQPTDDPVAPDDLVEPDDGPDTAAVSEATSDEADGGAAEMAGEEPGGGEGTDEQGTGEDEDDSEGEGEGEVDDGADEEPDSSDEDDDPDDDEEPPEYAPPISF